MSAYENDLRLVAKDMADENAQRRSEWAHYLDGQQWTVRVMSKGEYEERFGSHSSDKIVITRV